MKGLEAYIKKHGKHFTEDLATRVTCGKWNPSKVEAAAQSKVYYNVTASTVGDMVYLLDMAYERLYPLGQYTTNRGILSMLSWVQDYSKTESPFNIWISSLIIKDKGFDFTPYI